MHPGQPAPIPYGRHWIDEHDIAAVVEVLRSDWLTTGPEVARFEQAVCDQLGSQHAVAVNSGTAALHCCMDALRIGPGDEVIVPPLTFAATANCVLYQSAQPVFADIDPDYLLLDVGQLEHKVTRRTRAIIAVDYAGQPCDYEALRDFCRRHGLWLVADACHSLGGGCSGRPAGTLADLNVFSFHPVKPITSGEGGMVTTHCQELAERMRRFRNHGISNDLHQRAARQQWRYEIEHPGFNYRLNDLQAALARSQLRHLPAWTRRRQEIAARYDRALAGHPHLQQIGLRPGADHAYHLYVVRVRPQPGCDRDSVFHEMRRQQIGVNVHYPLVHFHPYYRRQFGTGPGLCPVAEQAIDEILTLPVFPAMTDQQVDHVVATLLACLEQQRQQAA